MNMLITALLAVLILLLMDNPCNGKKRPGIFPTKSSILIDVKGKTTKIPSTVTAEAVKHGETVTSAPPTTSSKGITSLEGVTSMATTTVKLLPTYQDVNYTSAITLLQYNETLNAVSKRFNLCTVYTAN